MSEADTQPTINTTNRAYDGLLDHTEYLEHHIEELKGEIKEEAHPHCKSYNASKARRVVKRLAEKHGYHYHHVRQARDEIRPATAFAHDNIIDRGYPGWLDDKPDHTLDGWRLYSWSPTGNRKYRGGRMAYIKPDVVSTDAAPDRYVVGTKTPKLRHILAGRVVEAVMPEKGTKWKIQSFWMDDTGGFREEKTESEPVVIKPTFTIKQMEAYNELKDIIRNWSEYGD